MDLFNRLEAEEEVSAPQQITYGDEELDAALDEIVMELRGSSTEIWEYFLNAVRQDPWPLLEYYKPHATAALLKSHSKRELMRLALEKKSPEALGLFTTFGFQTLRLLLHLDNRRDLAVLFVAAELEKRHQRLNDLYLVQYLIWMLEHKVLGFTHPWPEKDVTGEQIYSILAQSAEDDKIYTAVREELGLWVMSSYPPKFNENSE